MPTSVWLTDGAYRLSHDCSHQHLIQAHKPLVDRRGVPCTEERICAMLRFLSGPIQR